jgi:hypothetical protein
LGFPIYGTTVFTQFHPLPRGRWAEAFALLNEVASAYVFRKEERSTKSHVCVTPGKIQVSPTKITILSNRKRDFNHQNSVFVSTNQKIGDLTPILQTKIGINMD